MLQNAPSLIFGRLFDVIVECKLVFVHLSIVSVFLCRLNRFLLTAKLCRKFSWCLVVSIYCEKIRVLILNKLCWVWIWWLLILVIVWIFAGRFFFLRTKYQCYLCKLSFLWKFNQSYLRFSGKILNSVYFKQILCDWLPTFRKFSLIKTIQKVLKF